MIVAQVELPDNWFTSVRVCLQAAYLLPALAGVIRDELSGGSFGDCCPAVLVVGPTRELVIQIDRECHKFAHGTFIRSSLAYGGASVPHQKRELQRGSHVVVGTPGRLLMFVSEGTVSASHS